MVRAPAPTESLVVRASALSESWVVRASVLSESWAVKSPAPSESWVVPSWLNYCGHSEAYNKDVSTNPKASLLITQRNVGHAAFQFLKM